MDGSDPDIEHTLFYARECHVYKIPPRVKAEVIKCADWIERLWVGRMRIVAKGTSCTILLEDPDTNSLFAACPVNASGPDTVERVSDSSRYFVLRIEDGSGNHAFVGCGFEERSTAFDFNVALQDHAKYVQGRSRPGPELPSVAPGAFSLKEGQKIHVNIKRKIRPTRASGEREPQSSSQSSSGASSSSGVAGGGGADDGWGEFRSNSSGSSDPTPGDWVAF